jgi:S1-C subfamily serine protease
LCTIDLQFTSYYFWSEFMAALDEISASVEGLVERVGPAVVGLGRGWGRGSGVVTATGRVLTNAHNLRGDTVTVTFGDGRRETGTVAGVDIDGDVAVVSVDTGEVEPVEWAAEGDSPSIGRAVFALANPGGRGLRATFGLVSAAGRSFRGPRGRRIRGSIEHTAPLPRGSSGGPLVDADGRLLGLNTVRMDGGLIVAIPADASLRDRADALARGETPQPTRLGVAIAPPRVARRLQRAVGLPERDGLLVHGVEEGSPADRAGIEKGDLIVAAGENEVTRVDDLHQALDTVRGGGELELTLVRGADERKVTVSFAVVV